MNKLVSKNPVQRFKQGRKIVKAQEGLDTGTLNGRKVTKKGGIWTYDDTNSPIAGIDNKKVITGTGTKKKVSRTRLFPEEVDKNYTHNYLELLRKGYRPNKNGGLKESVKEKTSKTVSNTPYTRNTEYNSQYGLAGDIQRDWRGTKGVIADNDLKLLQEMGFQIQDQKNAAREAQQFIRDNGLGQYNVALDNAWGSQSSNALNSVYQMWKAKKEADVAAESLRPKSTSSPTIQLPQAPVMQRQAISDYSNYASNLKSALGNNNNFQGLSNLVWKEYADDDNSFAANFSRDMRTRFKNYNTQQSWLDNQAAIEKLLNISGRYRGSRSGDYGDLARSQASWAGKYNQGINKQNQEALNNYDALINRYKRAIGGYKIGGQLVSRNPVKRFKQKKFQVSGPVTTLKTGGNIPKYQEGNYIVKKGDTLSKIAKEKRMTLQQLLSLNKNIKDPNRIDIGQQIITQKITPKKVIKKAVKKPIKIKSAQQSASVAPLLSSAASNIKNWANNVYSGLTKMFTSDSQEYVDSKNKDLQAVLDHSAQLNNGYTYKYLDRTNNEIKWIRNGKVVDSAGIVSGVNDKSDGYTPLSKDSKGRPLYDRSLNLSSTPAGVFVLSKPRSGAAYDKGSLMYHLIEAKGDNKQGRYTNVAFHHAPESRKSQMSKGIKKLSFGCIYGDCDESQQKIDKNINQGDTIYSQPVEPGNYLYEENGKIKPHYTSTSPYASGKIFGQEFNLNNVRYNTGY